ncbi:hypothetical protein B0H14DRAFT_2556907 [Mycena olivaceomarginata]|nr:hypothetical protein B0H14DRAFT_2556907 [Mycena olivaceomarginata]
MKGVHWRGVISGGTGQLGWVAYHHQSGPAGAPRQEREGVGVWVCESEVHETGSWPPLQELPHRKHCSESFLQCWRDRLEEKGTEGGSGFRLTDDGKMIDKSLLYPPQHLPKLHTDGLVPSLRLAGLSQTAYAEAWASSSATTASAAVALIPNPAAVGALGVVAASVAVTGGRALRQSHISVDWKLTKLALWNSNRSISLTTGTSGSNNATPSSPPGSAVAKRTKRYLVLYFVRLAKASDYIRREVPEAQVHHAICTDCEALPIPVHPDTHPMLKMRSASTVVPAVYRSPFSDILRIEGGRTEPALQCRITSFQPSLFGNARQI